MSIEQHVRDYIFSNLIFSGDSAALGGDDSFLEKGIIDSTGVLELIFFLEQTFNVKIHDEDLVPENLDSVNRVVRFIEKKQAEGVTQ